MMLLAYTVFALWASLSSIVFAGAVGRTGKAMWISSNEVTWSGRVFPNDNEDIVLRGSSASVGLGDGADVLS